MAFSTSRMFTLRQVAGIAQTLASRKSPVFCRPHVVPLSIVSTTYRITTDSSDSTSFRIGSKDATPPVNAFWSITMYMIDGGWWFVPNALNKFTVSPRNNLKYNLDGSLTLYFQNSR